MLGIGNQQNSEMNQIFFVTLKDYDRRRNEWKLGFPNAEVREGFADCLYKYMMPDYVGSGDTLGIAFIDRYKIVRVK